MTGDVLSALIELPEPDPPPEFRRAVMAGVSRTAAVRRRHHPAAVQTRIGSRAHSRNWTELPSRVATIAGVAVVFISWTYGLLVAGTALDLVPLPPWLQTPLRMPLGGSATLGLALGLLLYVAGLFAPLRKGH